MEILSREDELKTRTITAQELFEILDNEVCEIDKELKQLQKAVAEYWKKETSFIDKFYDPKNKKKAVTPKVCGMTYDFDSKVICIIFSSCEYFEGDHELEIRYNLETKEMKALKIQKVPYFGNYNPNVEYNPEAVLKGEKTFLSNQADIKCLADHKEMIEKVLSKIKHFSEKYGETKKQAEVKLKSIIESIKINYYNLDTLFEYSPKNNELYPKINFVKNSDDAIPNEEASLFSPTIVEFCLGCEHHRKVILNNIFVEISTLPIEVQEIICSHYNNSNKPSVKKSVKNNRKRNPFDRKPHYRALP